MKIVLKLRQSTQSRRESFNFFINKMSALTKNLKRKMKSLAKFLLMYYFKTLSSSSKRLYNELNKNDELNFNLMT